MAVPIPEADALDSEELAAVLTRVCQVIAAAGGRAWLVGGVVRDGFLGLATGDLDLEVFGLPAADLRTAL